jgi:hypothetical protein
VSDHPAADHGDVEGLAFAFGSLSHRERVRVRGRGGSNPLQIAKDSFQDHFRSSQDRLVPEPDNSDPVG